MMLFSMQPQMLFCSHIAATAYPFANALKQSVSSSISAFIAGGGRRFVR
ncbi:hypothetical protein [Brenneria corticis]|nr:hypothetical protein [Brenneria sp. CFCC 11842]